MKKLFLFGFLVFLHSVATANPARPFIFPRTAFVEEITCNLPPPASLNVDVVGSNWVTVSWPAVSGASQYRLESYDGASGDALGAPLFVAGTATSATISTAGNTGTAYVRIWSVCENGEYPLNNFTQSATFDGPILDLVVSGFTAPSNYVASAPLGIGFASGQDVYWNGAAMYFDVQFTYYGAVANRQFYVTVAPGAGDVPDVVTIHPKSIGSGNGESEKISFDYNEYNESDQPIDFVLKFTADPNKKPEVIGEYSLAHPNANSGVPGKIYKDIAGNASCVVTRRIPENHFAPPSSSESGLAERGADSFITGKTTVNPNPFQDVLTVQIPGSNTRLESTVRLYDLLGAVKRTYSVATDQHELSFNTSDLAPGIYFIQIESGGNLETHKIVKTQ